VVSMLKNGHNFAPAMVFRIDVGEIAVGEKDKGKPVLMVRFA